jgi:hypothetical protein
MSFKIKGGEAPSNILYPAYNRCCISLILEIRPRTAPCPITDHYRTWEPGGGRATGWVGFLGGEGFAGLPESGRAPLLRCHFLPRCRPLDSPSPSSLPSLAPNPENGSSGRLCRFVVADFGSGLTFLGCNAPFGRVSVSDTRRHAPHLGVSMCRPQVPRSGALRRAWFASKVARAKIIKGLEED